MKMTNFTIGFIVGAAVIFLVMVGLIIWSDDDYDNEFESIPKRPKNL